VILIGVAIALIALAAFGGNGARTVLQLLVVCATVLLVGFLFFGYIVGASSGVVHGNPEQDCGWVLLGGAVLIFLLQLTKLTRRKSAPKA
jgi:hypothetical protein